MSETLSECDSQFMLWCGWDLKTSFNSIEVLRHSSWHMLITLSYSSCTTWCGWHTLNCHVRILTSLWDQDYVAKACSLIFSNKTMASDPFCIITPNIITIGYIEAKWHLWPGMTGVVAKVSFWKYVLPMGILTMI